MDDHGSHNVTLNRGNRYHPQVIRTPQHNSTEHNDTEESQIRQQRSRFSIDSNIHPRYASTDNDSATSAQTTQIIPSTLLEQQAPTLTASTKVAYDAFILAYEAYIMKGGVQLFKDRISPQAKNGYRTRISNLNN